MSIGFNHEEMSDLYDEMQIMRNVNRKVQEVREQIEKLNAVASANIELRPELVKGLVEAGKISGRMEAFNMVVKALDLDNIYFRPPEWK